MLHIAAVHKYKIRFCTAFLRPVLWLLKFWWGKKIKIRILTLSDSTRSHFTAAQD